MAWRVTVVGRMPPEEKRREILEAFELTAGDHSRAAFVLCVSRKQLYRYVNELGLGPAIDRIRARVIDDFTARRARVRGEPT